jgi:hypothetical protein
MLDVGCWHVGCWPGEKSGKIFQVIVHVRTDDRPLAMTSD